MNCMHFKLPTGGPNYRQSHIVVYLQSAYTFLIVRMHLSIKCTHIHATPNVKTNF